MFCVVDSISRKDHSCFGSMAMAGLFNRILYSPVENFIRTRFSLPNSSLDPFSDFENHFLKIHLISVPVNELDNRSLIRSQYKSILIPVIQLIVILKFLIITLNEDKEFLVKIGAGMMPFQSSHRTTQCISHSLRLFPIH